MIRSRRQIIRDVYSRTINDIINSKLENMWYEIADVFTHV